LLHPPLLLPWHVVQSAFLCPNLPQPLHFPLNAPMLAINISLSLLLDLLNFPWPFLNFTGDAHTSVETWLACNTWVQNMLT
jgi:hypothetical protein